MCSPGVNTGELRSQCSALTSGYGTHVLIDSSLTFKVVPNAEILGLQTTVGLIVVLGENSRPCT